MIERLVSDALSNANGEDLVWNSDFLTVMLGVDGLRGVGSIPCARYHANTRLPVKRARDPSYKRSYSLLCPNLRVSLDAPATA